jgi:putative component of membrane protein insertase Oxa1/YidC/SpoIIIJ protein YidD
MKYLVLFLIKIYQTIFPKRYRGKCLFKESCSNFVYRMTKEEGLKGGIQAFIYRYHNCRPDYQLFEDNGRVLLITVKKELIEESLIDERLLFENRNSP